MKKRGERGGWGGFFLWGSRIGNALEGATNPMWQQNKTTTKHKCSTAFFHIAISTTNAHSQHPECHWVRERDTKGGKSHAVHKTWWCFNVSIVFHGQRHTEQTTGVKVERQRNNFDLRAQHKRQTSNGHVRGRAFSRWGFPPVDPFQTKTRFRV